MTSSCLRPARSLREIIEHLIGLREAALSRTLDPAECEGIGCELDWLRDELARLGDCDGAAVTPDF